MTNKFTLKFRIPKTEAEWKVIKNRFNDQGNFPNFLRAVDGKHVSIKNHHTQVHTTTTTIFFWYCTDGSCIFEL